MTDFSHSDATQNCQSILIWLISRVHRTLQSFTVYAVARLRTVCLCFCILIKGGLVYGLRGEDAEVATEERALQQVYTTGQ
ncbi:hypothetical protein J4Q44_G00110470 [Coregonus suidteri]|uniref:Uncharacterized protein n=1 Tax=Coregonus suidteri TaxID=861788 RepID=A0AAN8M5B2_9TELE